MKLPHKIKIELLDEANETVEYSLQYLKNFNYSRSILEMCSIISFDISKSNVGMIPSVLPYENENRIKVISALTPGRMVKAYIDDFQIFFGYIITIDSSSSNSEDLIKVKCKDVIWRLDATTLFTNRTQAGNQQLEQFILFALDGLQSPSPVGKPDKFDGWDIYKNNSITFTQEEFLKTVSGKTSDADLESEAASVKTKDSKAKDNESIYSYIKRSLQPYGFIIQADSKGNLMVFRPNMKDSPRFSFVNDFNKTKSYSDSSAPILGDPCLKLDLDKVHSTIFVYGNSVTNDEGRSMIYASYENPDFPRNKADQPLVRNNLFHKDTNLKTKASCLKMAKRKAAFENANFYNYDFAVAGFGLGGIIFSNDIVVTIADSINGVNRNLYVKSIEFSATPESQISRFSACLTTAMLLE